MSGPELASRVKMIKPDVAVVIMTSFEVDKDMIEVLPLIEWSDLLQDPFNTTDVCVAVNRHLTGVSC